MKKFEFIKNYKLWIVIALALIVAGAIITGVFGFAKSADIADGYELEVTVSENLGDTQSTVEKNCGEFFSEKGLKVLNVLYKDDGKTVIYQLNGAVGDDLASELENKIGAQILQSLTVEVSSETTLAVLRTRNFLFALLAFGIVLVLAFVYSLIRYKAAAACALTFASAVEILLALSLISVFRIRISETVLSVLLASFALTLVSGISFVNKSKELLKSNSALTYAECAESAVKYDFIRNAAVTGAAVLFGLLLTLFGSTLIKYVGLQIIAAALSAGFTVICLTGVIWTCFKGLGKTPKVKKTKTSDSEEITEN